MSRSRGSKAPAPPAEKPRAWGPRNPKPGHVLHEQDALAIRIRRAARQVVLDQALRDRLGALVKEVHHADGTSTYYWANNDATSIVRLPDGPDQGA